MAYEALPAAPFDERSVLNVKLLQALPQGRFVQAVKHPIGSRVCVRSVSDGSLVGPPIPILVFEDADVTPDGALCVIADDYVAKVVSVADGKVLATTEAGEWPIKGVCVMPDGKQFITSTLVHELNLRSAADGSIVRPLRDSTSNASFGGMTLSRDGRSLVYCIGGKVCSVDTATGREQWSTTLGTGPQQPRISPDGARVLVSTHDGPVILAAGDGQKLQQGPAFDNDGVQWNPPYGESWGPWVGWSADSERVLYVANDGDVWVAPAADLGRASEHARTPDLAWANTLTWVDAHRALVGTAHGKVLLIDAESGRVERDLGTADEDPPEVPNPVMAAIASFILPGVGQVMNGQLTKGILIFVLNLLTAYFCGLGSLVFAVEAYMVASKRKAGQDVGEWSFF